MLFSSIDEELNAKGMDDRSAASLVNASLGFTVRNETYRLSADVSVPSASRDLKALVLRDYLEAKGQGRGRHYVAGPWLLNLIRKFPKPQKIPSPFLRST